MGAYLDQYVRTQATRMSREQWEDGNSETPDRLIPAMEMQIRCDLDHFREVMLRREHWDQARPDWPWDGRIESLFPPGDPMLEKFA